MSYEAPEKDENKNCRRFKERKTSAKLVSRANRACDQLTGSTCEFACATFVSLRWTYAFISQDQITSFLCVLLLSEKNDPFINETTNRNRSQLMPQCLVSLCKFSVWSAVSSLVRGHFSIELSWVECIMRIWVRMIGISSVLFVSVAYHLYDWTIWQQRQPGIERNWWYSHCFEWVLNIPLRAKSCDWKVKQISISYVNF